MARSAKWTSGVLPALRRARRFHSRWLAIIPLVLIALDFIRFPCVFAGNGPKEPVDVQTLLDKKLVTMGTLYCRSVHVSSDNFTKKDFLHYIRGSQNALVISYFLEKTGPSPRVLEGALGRALKEKLAYSPETRDRLNGVISGLVSHSVGYFTKLDVIASKEPDATFPINRIYLALLNGSRSASNKDALEEIIPKVVRTAAEDGMTTVVIPCFGYDWKHSDVSFDEFFAPLLRAVGTTQAPSNIYIPLHEDWEQSVLGRAVASLVDRWQRQFTQAVQDDLFGLLRSEYRTILFFLFVCQFVSSFYTRLTIQNWVVISTAFLALALGIPKTTDFFSQGYVTFPLMLKAAARLGLALLFPFIVHFNPGNVFAPKRR